MLFYAPSWWLRIPVVCTPFTWDDTMEYIREKLGRKKKVRLPQTLVDQTPAPSRGSTPPRYTEPEVYQTRMEDLDPQDSFPEGDTGAADLSGESQNP